MNTNKNNSACFALGVSDFSTSEPLLNAQTIIECGMDFIEPGLAKIAGMSDEDFEKALKHIKEHKIRVQSVNWFLPPEIKVTGPNVDPAASRQFLEHALARATTLGAQAVVFGSPGSRTLPAGFSPDEGRQQMIAFCRMCSDVIREHDWQIRIAVEHVNHTVMLEAGDLICAVQLADPDSRYFPRPGAAIPGLDQFFSMLIEIGYSGGVSVEATVGDDLTADCRGAVERLKQCF